MDLTSMGVSFSGLCSLPMVQSVLKSGPTSLSLSYRTPTILSTMTNVSVLSALCTSIKISKKSNTWPPTNFIDSTGYPLRTRTTRTGTKWMPQGNISMPMINGDNSFLGEISYQPINFSRDFYMKSNYTIFIWMMNKYMKCDMKTAPETAKCVPWMCRSACRPSLGTATWAALPVQTTARLYVPHAAMTTSTSTTSAYKLAPTTTITIKLLTHAKMGILFPRPQRHFGLTMSTSI